MSDPLTAAPFGSDALDRLRTAYASGLTRPVAWRREQLSALRRMLVEGTDEIGEAVRADLGRHPLETRALETDVLIDEVDQVLAHLEDWLAPQPVATPLSFRPARAEVVLEPLGVVLVISPWNYPVNLALSPLIGALAAGNVALLKPSEVAPATAAMLARMLPQHLDPRAVQVVQGGPDETGALLEQRFDHIFFTGNAHVARIVMRAAAEHLTPVTLELGGKSPAWVDDSADLAAVARRLVWGKFVNAGQTCVAPDHVLATPEVNARLLGHLVSALRDAYGDDPRQSPSFGRIVNERHAARLAGLLEGTQPAVGGQVDVAQRYVAPTILRATADDPVMAQEIFGPILPLIDVADLDAAVRLVGSGPKPLAMYLFTEREPVVQEFLARTSSGGVGVNVPLAHLGVAGLPFGGVGESGIGRYHGRHSIEALSHHRAVLRKPLAPDTLRAVYPPYTRTRRAVLGGLLAARRLPVPSLARLPLPRPLRRRSTSGTPQAQPPSILSR